MTCLDASKSGLTVKPDVFEKDRKAWDYEKPDCLKKSEELEKGNSSGRRPMPRRREFVLEDMWDAANKMQKES